MSATRRHAERINFGNSKAADWFTVARAYLGILKLIDNPACQNAHNMCDQHPTCKLICKTRLACDPNAAAELVKRIEEL